MILNLLSKKRSLQDGYNPMKTILKGVTDHNMKDHNSSIDLIESRIHNLMTNMNDLENALLELIDEEKQ